MTIRILHLINQVGYGGGAERQLLLNLKHFDNNQIKSIVCQLYPEDYGNSGNHAISEIRELGVQALSLNVKSKFDGLIAFFKLLQLIRNQNIEVIHTSLMLADVFGLLAGLITRVPVVVTLVNVNYGHDWSKDHPTVKQWKYRLFLALYGFLLRHCCSKVIANSNAVKANAVQHLRLSPGNVKVIYRSLSPKWLSSLHITPQTAQTRMEALRAELGVTDAYPILLNVARVSPAKGQLYLIKALTQLKFTYPNIKLLIAGENNRQVNLEKAAEELDVQTNVLLLGHRDDVQSLHQLSNVGVFSSLYEGFGNALAEACASALPCVVTDIGGFTEVVDDGRAAVVVPSRSSEALAEGIVKLLEYPSKATQLGRQAQQYVLTHFSIEHTIKTLTEVYRQAAKK